MIGHYNAPHGSLSVPFDDVRESYYVVEGYQQAVQDAENGLPAKYEVWSLQKTVWERDGR